MTVSAGNFPPTLGANQMHATGSGSFLWLLDAAINTNGAMIRSLCAINYEIIGTNVCTVAWGPNLATRNAMMVIGPAGLCVFFPYPFILRAGLGLLMLGNGGNQEADGTYDLL